MVLSLQKSTDRCQFKSKYRNSCRPLFLEHRILTKMKLMCYLNHVCILFIVKVFNYFIYSFFCMLARSCVLDNLLSNRNCSFVLHDLDHTPVQCLLWSFFQSRTARRSGLKNVLNNPILDSSTARLITYLMDTSHEMSLASSFVIR